MTTLSTIGHATSILLLTGFCVFVWMIYKKLRKTHRRGRKAHRRMINSTK